MKEEGLPGEDSFESLLSGLSEAVGERIDALHASPSSSPDPVFYNEGKVVHHWPDVVGLVIEELR